MKKYLLSVLVAIASFLGLILGVSAAEPPATFDTQDVIKLTEYVPGVVQYYKPIAGGLEVFCEDSGLTYVTGITYQLKGQVHDGYIYIFEHRPNTGDKYKDYYIQSIAVWWFKDYLNGNNVNIPQGKKNYIINHASTDEVCRLILELVEGAKAYKQEQGYMAFDSNTVTWTESGDNFISSKITVTASNLTGGGINLTGAPEGSKIINSTVDASGNGTIQIQVPKSAVTPGKTYSFKLEGTAKYKMKRMYDYHLDKVPGYDYEYQDVIYGKIYSTTYQFSISKKITLTRDVNKLTITKYDKETGKPLAGAGLTLYKGDCSNTTCTSANKYETWTSTTSAKEFTNLPLGYYTLVETKTPDGYLTAAKQVVNVTSTSGNYELKMYDAKAHNKLVIYKQDQDGAAVSGAKLTLYKGDCTNTTCTDKYATWTTNGSAKEFADIAVGVYTLVETSTPAGYKTAAKMLINVNSNNKTFTYKMIDVKETKTSVRISKTDVTGQKEIAGATLELKDSNGNLKEKWVSQSTPHYVTLEPGEYFLKETIAPKGYILSTDTINFKVDANGLIFQKASNGTWVKVDYIKMINETRESINISKLDSETNEYVSGAVLRIKDEKGDIVATWTTAKESHYVSLDAGTYILEEVSAPKGYNLNNKPIYFKVDDAGKAYLVDSKGSYTIKVNGIIMYNEPEQIIVPPTGLSSTLAYTLGTLVLGLGAIMLYRNEKQC